MVHSGKAIVGVLGGSKSDFQILEKAGSILAELQIPYELLVVSAHRTPDRLFEYASTAPGRGIEVIIAGAGGAAMSAHPITPQILHTRINLSAGSLSQY
ncbi:MAG: AIR carboxylase family protein [Nitrospira sp.]|nr:AIR carboxylase family protein [Nitrospira sp.]